MPKTTTFTEIVDEDLSNATNWDLGLPARVDGDTAIINGIGMSGTVSTKVLRLTALGGVYMGAVLDVEHVLVGTGDFYDTSTLATASQVQAGVVNGPYVGDGSVEAAQLATDVAAVNAGKVDIKTTRTILTVAGTYDAPAAIASAVATQLATDVAAVAASSGFIVYSASILGVQGSFPASPQDDPDRVITIVRGDDYKLADNRAISFRPASPPNLTGASVSLLIISAANNTTVGTTIGTVTNPALNPTITFDMSATQTAALPVTPRGQYALRYAVAAVLADGDKATLESGRVDVRAGTP